MTPTTLAAGVLVGAGAYWLWRRGQDSEIDSGGWLDAAADFVSTYDMTNQEALGSPNVQAFLMLIRVGEGTADANGYRKLVGGDLFSGFADHPRQRVWIPKINDYSTAAGAYQILAKTWAIVRVAAGLSDFSPESQDLAAVQLIRRRGALADVLAGNLSGALEKCSWEWASLPPWRYSNQGTMTAERAGAIFAQFGGGSAYV